MRSSFAAACNSCARQAQRAHTSSLAWRRVSPLVFAQQRTPALTPALAVTALDTALPRRQAHSPSSFAVRPFSQSARDARNKKKEPKEPKEPKPRPSLPFYDLFAKALPSGPPPEGAFRLDRRALHREYLQMQAAAHPDFHHEAGAGEAATYADADADAEANPSARGHSTARARAEAQSAHINEAYRTLASPLLRVQYILRERYGVDLANDENTMVTEGEAGDAALRTTKAEDNMRLLMAVLQVREQIEAVTCYEDLEPIRALNDRRMQRSEDIIEAALALEDIQAVQEEAVRLRYWVNIDEVLRNWERGKDIVLEH